MNLKQNTDYSLRILMYVAHTSNDRVSAREICDFYAISYSHTVKIVNKLGKLGYLDLKRGRYGGGIALAMDPSEIDIGTVVGQFETNFEVVECFNLDTNSCSIVGGCKLKSIFEVALAAFFESLAGKTLADIVPTKNAAQAKPAISPWSSPEVVARFSTSPPNKVLISFAKHERQQNKGTQVLDIGCGAGSNAVPLAQMGWKVMGLDLSAPMLEAATRRGQEAGLTEQLQVKQAPMDQLPVEDQSIDFIVAHGIWNLARSATEFRAAVREAARVARPGAALFLYTFSRSTFPPDIKPIQNETFIYTEFSGKPQCFLTEQQLIEELEAGGFVQEPGRVITEYPQPATGKKPAIFEGLFRRR